VELKTDALNEQSRRAMAKLGLTCEGVMRRQMRRPDGSWRDHAWFSVIAPEWPLLKARIEARLAAFS
jgi:RimJ/RimL family protein N-acetyltransferase